MHEVRDDLPDALRVVPDPERLVRELVAEPDASLARGAVGLFHGRFDRGAKVVRPQLEQDEP